MVYDVVVVDAVLHNCVVLDVFFLVLFFLVVFFILAARNGEHNYHLTVDSNLARSELVGSYCGCMLMCSLS